MYIAITCLTLCVVFCIGQVGQTLRKATAGTGKKLSLELGGKSPFVVYDSADLDSTVEGVVNAIYFNQGQVCNTVFPLSSLLPCLNNGDMNT